MFKLLAKLVHILLPEFCIFCDTEGGYLCTDCAQKRFVYYTEHKCHVCKKDVKEGAYVHQQCRSQTNLCAVFTVVHYSQAAKKLLQEFKYQFNYQIGKVIAEMMIQRFQQIPLSFDAVVPVPLHRRKLWYRGFNQSELLAKSFGLPCKNLLKRVRYTKTQAQLNKTQRQQNVNSIFALNSSISSENQKILLVDDVMTTGATLEECAKVLREYGRQDVYAIVWARD